MKNSRHTSFWKRQIQKEAKQYQTILNHQAIARCIMDGSRPLIYPLIAIEDDELIIEVKCKPFDRYPIGHLWFRCPLCHKYIYHHTYDRTSPGSGDGWRGSHCPCWSGIGYTIREIQPGKRPRPRP